MQKILHKASQVFATIIFAFALSFVLNINLFISMGLFSSQQKIETPVAKKDYEVFGFAPYWTINSLDNVDYNTLTTMAYFGVPMNADGTLDKTHPGYTTIFSPKAKEAFKIAKSHGTRVVLTMTQMDNDDIKSLLDNPVAQVRSIRNTVKLARENDFGGINIDVEYVGNPGAEYREKFTKYVEKFTSAVHKNIPGSQVTVSVYAAAVKDPKLYDIGALSGRSDKIFMMAYDFATKSSTAAVPTSPLYGYKEGKYWYDVSTAVKDFLKVMPAEKLVLGLPWYGYNYPVQEVAVKAEKYDGYYYNYYSRGRRYTAYYSYPSKTQTMSLATSINPEQTGWDDTGKVGWRAYKEDGIWRMIFLEDSRSLKLKYEFAKENGLAGVGIWALGFDSGSSEMWDLLSAEFGTQIADARQ